MLKTILHTPLVVFMTTGSNHTQNTQILMHTYTHTHTHTVRSGLASFSHRPPPPKSPTWYSASSILTQKSPGWDPFYTLDLNQPMWIQGSFRMRKILFLSCLLTLPVSRLGPTWFGQRS